MFCDARFALALLLIALVDLFGDGVREELDPKFTERSMSDMAVIMVLSIQGDLTVLRRCRLKILDRVTTCAWTGR